MQQGADAGSHSDLNNVPFQASFRSHSIQLSGIALGIMYDHVQVKEALLSNQFPEHIIRVTVLCPIHLTVILHGSGGILRGVQSQYSGQRTC